jgi:orotate phosphoribosyltransferase
MFPATILATELHLPLGIVGDDKLYGGKRLPIRKNDGPFLVIDDSVSKGEAMKNARLKNLFPNSLYACVYMLPGSEHHVDFYCKTIPYPRIFEWGIFNCHHIKTSLLDLDGVLCKNLTVTNDDGEKYKNAITTAIPFHIPKYNVMDIVTGRIERWRPETITWLNKYNIKYNELVMAPYETQVECRKHDMGVFKGEYFLNSPATLFIESHDIQAKKINEISKKPVISLESMQVFQK